MDQTKDDTYLIVINGTKVEGNESEPDDTSSVHGEADKLGFVKVLRDLACLDRIDRTRCDQEYVVDERRQEVGIIDFAFEHDFGFTIRIREPVTRRRGLNHEPDTGSEHLVSESCSRTEHFCQPEDVELSNS